MLKTFRKICKDEIFCVGCDLSVGCGDWTIAQFFSITSMDVPLVWATHESGTALTNWLWDFAGKLSSVTGTKPLISYERNNGGAFEMDRLASLNRDARYEIYTAPVVGEGDTNANDGRSDKLGWDTNQSTRPEMLSNMKTMLENNIVKIYDKQTIEELFSFIVNRHNNSLKAEAEKNAHDDRVMALAIALKISQLYPLDRLRGADYTNQLRRYYQNYNKVSGY